MTAEVENPVVVDAAVGGCELVVRAFGFPGEAHGGVEDGSLDALGVEDFEALNRVYGAGLKAFAVGDLARGQQVSDVFADAAGPAEHAAGDEVASWLLTVYL